MKKTIIFSIIGVAVLFIGIKIGAQTSIAKQVRDFEVSRHQNIATEIELQIKLLRLMTDNKYAEADTLLMKWIEQNVCEMGAYKQSKFFIADREVTAIILRSKKALEDKKFNINSCSAKTFVGYSGQFR